MFKEVENMKALRYLLMVVAMVSVLSVKAQSTAQLPEVQMQSTSVMMSSGSNLPSAAINGVTTTNEQVLSPANAPSGPNRKRPEDWEDPYKDPIGDAVWPLMALAAAFAFGKWIARTKPLR